VRAPAGLTPVTGPRGSGFAAPEAAAWVAQALAGGHMLRDVAASHPDALELRGRGPVYAMPAGAGRWVVRPYRRGGSVMGPLLGDRHLRAGESRPLAEARASAEVLVRGIPTPRVLAGAVYPAGVFYRADLVTEYIADSENLAGAVVEATAGGPEERSSALVAAGHLLARMALAGVEHPDMNARNVLLLRREGRLIAMLLDLDRCRVRGAGRGASSERMLRRLERSLERIAERSGTVLRDEDRAELRHAAGGRS